MLTNVARNTQRYCSQRVPGARKCCAPAHNVDHHTALQARMPGGDLPQPGIFFQSFPYYTALLRTISVVLSSSCESNR